MKESEIVRQKSKEVLQFLKQRYPLFHLSNVFFRDLHYGVREYLEQNGMKIGYAEAEGAARDFIQHLEGEKILVPVDRQTWTLHYPEFQKPKVKAPEPVKPAPKPPAPPSKPQGGENA
jgi:hypothetical protein